MCDQSRRHRWRGYQHRALLNVQLQIGGNGTGAVAAIAFVANVLQLTAEGDPITVGPPIDVLRGEAAGYGAGDTHGR